MIRTRQFREFENGAVSLLLRPKPIYLSLNAHKLFVSFFEYRNCVLQYLNRSKTCGRTCGGDVDGDKIVLQFYGEPTQHGAVSIERWWQKINVATNTKANKFWF